MEINNVSSLIKALESIKGSRKSDYRVFIMTGGYYSPNPLTLIVDNKRKIIEIHGVSCPSCGSSNVFWTGEKWVCSEECHEETGGKNYFTTEEGIEE